jgi:hypothetical protein
MCDDPSNDHDIIDAAVARELHASLKSFAFTPKSPSQISNGSNHLQRKESVQKTGLKRRSSLDELDIKLDFYPSTSRIPSPRKKKKRGYAAPETYAHLRVLQDILTEGLDGTSPCIQSTLQ